MPSFFSQCSHPSYPILSFNPILIGIPKAEVVNQNICVSTIFWQFLLKIPKDGSFSLEYLSNKVHQFRIQALDSKI